jgi:F-type H+-transporting ATPase subunit delta
MAIVTSRYARALADVIFKQKLDPQQVAQQLHVFVDLMHENHTLRIVWENPAIPAEQKRRLLDALVIRTGSVKPVRNFLAVLIDHHRIHQLEEIFRAFEHELNERLGFAEAEVISARVLSDQEKRELELQIMNITGKRVLGKYATDAKLLGGAIVKLGSTIYDGSVRGQLQKIKEQLSS